MSAADGLARISRHLDERSARRVMTGAATLSVILSAFLPGRQPLWRIFAADHYAPSESASAGRKVLPMIPVTASIVAQSVIVPHLSLRQRIFVLDSHAPDADYVIACDSLNP